MSRRTLMLDAGAAVLIAALVLIFTPGLAVAALLALLVVLVCGVSFAVDGVARRRRRAGRRRGKLSARRR